MPFNREFNDIYLLSIAARSHRRLRVIKSEGDLRVNRPTTRFGGSPFGLATRSRVRQSSCYDPRSG